MSSKAGRKSMPDKTALRLLKLLLREDRAAMGRTVIAQHQSHRLLGLPKGCLKGLTSVERVVA